MTMHILRVSVLIAFAGVSSKFLFNTKISSFKIVKKYLIFITKNYKKSYQMKNEILFQKTHKFNNYEIYKIK